MADHSYIASAAIEETEGQILLFSPSIIYSGEERLQSMAICCLAGWLWLWEFKHL
jgi:hypothetical protein